ncbi:tRNA adenosine(34) deaminase TadA [Pseudoalteromonas phenolica]|uniref:tRNA-specific adenosine deaminase n=1 Tax=Pseudoalteromonas phenolica TaxID=161398 RepID=A0A0S2JZ53_9GAMM|nr:tRNA adenosine(34) deaminase TadA [Pseudoalteromonas phenolica]ALO41276.1 tRNA-specific adenosine deaminase [Pseudoalteromonas phenolica]MBE0354185.1 tRNA(adenine34) deaminase [Pseudoalteromonas phenolica O-BC30]TMO54695.1 tRNA adenosine(34) deaminase TadA [Pseudoalteromonas phenolica]
MTEIEQDQYWMLKALEYADKAEQQNEIPVGAVLVKDGELVSAGWNQSICNHDPSAHAEMMAVREAGKKIENYRLIDCTLYVTLEPCPMCAGLLVHSRIKRLVYGAADAKTGSAGSIMNIVREPKLNHQLEVTSGVMADQCAEKLSAFFRRRRKEIKEAKRLAKQAAQEG